MDITPYVEGLRRDLQEAAATGDATVADVAARLGAALAPAARLALMEAISQAAAEITSRMPDASVDVRLTGRDLDFVVEHEAAAPAPPPPVAPPPAAEEEGGVARVSLRLPESVKARAEELAAAHDQSLNAWLVDAVRQATSDTAVRVDVDLSSIPFLDQAPFGHSGRGGDRAGRGGRGGRRMTGWV